MNNRNNSPNILIIMSDDQGPWAMGCAGTPELLTPRLDQLATQGIRFDNFFCASPVCSPARASFLTGRIPSQHGIHDWIKSGNIDEKIISPGVGPIGQLSIYMEQLLLPIFWHKMAIPVPSLANGILVPVLSLRKATLFGLLIR